MPVAIVAGSQDRLIESNQAVRLNGNIPQSTLRSVPGAGHMVHQTAPAEIMSVVDMVADQKDRQALGPRCV
jgi:pimeloyl-ACP methyl ester carboxylesterase